MEPRVTKRERKLHLSYELPHRVHSAQLYPTQAPNGSTVIVYAHDRGLRILWRGGRRRRESPYTSSRVSGRAHDPDVIILDDGDEDMDGAEPGDQLEDEEDELDPDCPYPNIIQEVDIELDAEVLHLAVPSLPTSFRKTHALSRHAAVAVSCSDYSLRVITFDLLSPTDIGRREYVAGVLARQILFNNSSSYCSGLAAKIAVPDSSQSDSQAGSTSFLLAAAVSDTLHFYRFAIFDDLTNTLLSRRLGYDLEDAHDNPRARIGLEKLEIVDLKAHLPYSATNLAFHPSASSTAILLSDKSGAVRIYDPFPPAADGETDTMLDREEHSISSSGKWLFTFLTSYTSNGGAISRRKQVLDAAWILNGKAILTLLEDGEWSIHSLSPSATPTSTAANPCDPVLRGYLGAASTTTGDPTRPPKTSSRLAPMTPNTRKAKAETFFAADGPAAKAPGAAAQGGISVVTSSLRAAGQTDESVILWYNGEIYSIPSLQTFWQRSTTGKNGGGSGGGGMGSLYAPGPSHISDVNLVNEGVTSISQFAPSAASSGTGQMNTQRDLLVAGDHRLVVLQTLRPAVQARALFQQAAANATTTGAGAERPAAADRDQRMLDAGHLDLGGMDRLLEGMAGGEASRTRRVGFAR
ncbi:hypothetical protein B0A55_02550 [Friedmanniomyces simplex]|uniref:Uncharacterized protein n=1 Tax=Friedmanniomyces simplex TaxID=329884 RepID=A0A4U0XNP7_9PEZI|nr:hypothetical protein B0A55_02550 [Friedmanniomyces simplex]